MSEIPVQDTRNIVLLGHTGTGKTTLVDAILHKTGLIDRLGSTTNGTSFADWTDEEKERKLSIWAKPFQAIYKTAAGKPIKLVVIDTPGYMDFVGQSVAAASVADAALIVVDALAGIQVQVSSGSTMPVGGSGSSSTSAQLANGCRACAHSIIVRPFRGRRGPPSMSGRSSAHPHLQRR